MKTLYVYVKGNKIKVLDHDTALKTHRDILVDGWKHTNTINPCLWIENLYNDTDDLSEAVKKLAQ